MNLLRLLRWTALAEATSFLALLVATYFKRTGEGEGGVQVLGPIHGVLFVVYLWLVLRVRPDMRWDLRTTLWLLAGAVLPFGGYVADRWLARQRPPRAATA